MFPFQFLKNSYFNVLQGSVATLFRWCWKFNSTLWLIYPLHINFYQNRSSIVEVMIKNDLVCFYASQRRCELQFSEVWYNYGQKYHTKRGVRHWGITVFRETMANSTQDWSVADFCLNFSKNRWSATDLQCTRLDFRRMRLHSHRSDRKRTPSVYTSWTTCMETVSLDLDMGCRQQSNLQQH